MATKEIIGQGVVQYGAAIDPSLTKAMGQIVSHMSQLSNATGQANKAVVNFSKGTVSVVTGLNAISSGADRASRSSEHFSHNMFHASIATGALTASLIAMGKQLGDVAYGYDRNMTLVKAVTGATDSEFQKLSATARELGAQTEFGATKAAEGLLVLSRMGLNAAESMQVLGPAMKLAQSQQEDMAMSSEMLIQQLKVFGKGTEEAESFANVLAATASRTAADVEKLNDSLAYAGPIASTVGRSFEETNAILGMMYNAGIKASTAGTSLRFAMASLVGATSRSNKVLERMGLTMEDLNPTTHTFSQILGTLADKLKGAEDKTKILFDLFGKRAAPAMAAVIGQVIRNRDAFDDLLGKISDTNEVQKQYEVQMNSMSGALNKLGSQVQELAISIGDEFAPTIRYVSESLGKIVMVLAKLPGPVKSMAVGLGVAATAGLGLVAVFTSMRYMGSILGGTMQAMNNSFQGVKASVAGLSFKSLIVDMTALTAVEKNFVNLLHSEVAARLKQNLIKNKVDADTAESIVQLSLEAAATKRLSGEKYLAVKATLAQAQAEGILTKGQAHRAKMSVEGILLANGYSNAVAGQTKQLGVLQAAAMRTGIAFKAMWAAMGGWIGAALIGIPMVIGLITKMNAESAESKRKYAENTKAMIDLNKDLINSQNTLKNIGLEIGEAKGAGELEKVKNLMDEYANKAKDVEDIKQKIIDIDIKYLAGINAETGALIINNDELEKEVNHRRKIAEMKSMEGLSTDKDRDSVSQILQHADAADNLAQRYEILAGGVQYYSAKLKDVQDVLQPLRDTEREQLELLTETEKQQGVNSRAYATYKAGLAGTREAMKDLVEEEKSNDTALLILRNRMKELASSEVNVSEKSEDLDDDLDGIGDTADKISSKLQNLIDKLEQLNLKYDGLKESLELEISDAGATDIQKEFNKITKEFNKDMNDIAKDYMVIEQVFDKVKSSIAASKGGSAILGSEEFKEAENLLDGFKKKYFDVTDLILIKNEDLRRAFVEDYLEKVKNTAGETILKLEELKDANDKSLSGSVSQFRNEAIRETKKQNLEIEKQIKSLKELKDVLDKLPEVTAQEKQSVQDLIDSLNKLGELQGINKLKDALKKIDDEIKTIAELKIELGDYDSYYLGGIDKAKASIPIKDEYAKSTKDIYGEGSKEHLQALLDLKKANQSVADEVGKVWSGVTASIGGAIGVIAIEVSKTNKELGESLSMLGEAISSFSSGYKDFANFAVNTIIKGASDMWANRRGGSNDQENAKRMKEEEEKRQAAATEALIGLKAATLELKLSFESMSESIAGFSSSIQSSIIESMKAWSEFSTVSGQSSDSFKKLVSVLYAGEKDKNRLLPQGSNTKQFLDLAVSDSTQALEYLKSTLFNASADMFSGNNSSYTGDDLTEVAFGDLTDDLKTLVDESDPEKMANKMVALQKALLTEFLSTFRSDLFDPLIAVTKDGSVTFDEMAVANKSILDRLLYVSGIDKEGFSPSRFDTSFRKAMPNLLADPEFSTPFFNTMKEAIESSFDLGLKGAVASGDTEGVKSLYEEYKSNILLMTNDMKNIPESVRSSFQEILATLDEELLKSLEEAGKFLLNLTDKSDELVQSFKNGSLSFSTAMSSFDNMIKKLGNIPDEFKDDVQAIVKNFRENLFDALEDQIQDVSNLPGEIASEGRKTELDLYEMNEQMNDVVNNWNSLIEERDALLNGIGEEAQKLMDDSEQRVKSLEDERDALLGTFSFDETQNQRSNRFAQVRQLEQDILDEIASTQEKLRELEEERLARIEEIDKELEKLEIRYGNINNVYEEFSRMRNEREKTYIDYLKEVELKLLSITGKVYDLSGAYKEAFNLTGDVSDSALAASAAASSASSMMPSIGSDIGEPAAVVGVSTPSIQDPMMASSASDYYKGYSYPEAQGNSIEHAKSVVSEIGKMLRNFSSAGLFAQHGFSGVVKKPTTFHTGEFNRPEVVNITPVSDLAKMANGIGSNSVTNIYINDQLDFRGAYGITDRKVAEEVYRKVWAPARRNNLNRFFNTKGKVIQ